MEWEECLAWAVSNKPSLKQLRFCSQQNLKTLRQYAAKLDRITQDFNGPMLLVSKKQANRVEEMVQALRLTLDARDDPLLKLAKRQLDGRVIEEELIEFEEWLGSGSFGVVKAGEYYGRPVAIKRALRGGISDDEREAFR